MARRGPWLVRGAASVLVGLVGCDAAVPLPSSSPANVRFERTAVVGASLSSGFCAEALARKMRDVVPPGGEVLDASDFFFFLAPVERGRAAVDEVLEFRPTFVLAIDFLFWFAYEGGDLEVGLALLDPIRAPMVVGDVPWMREAAPWLGLDIPDPRSIDRVNERIRAWAAARTNVVVVPLSMWAEEAYRGMSRSENGRVGIEPGALVFLDGLHPTDAGADILLDRALAAAR